MERDHQKAPRHVDEQSAPEPERLVTPQEEAGENLSAMEHPPQAEGPDRAEPQGDGDDGRGAEKQRKR